MIQVSILIPPYDNAGDKFSPKYHKDFQAHLMSLFGGYRFVPRTVKGQWSDGTKTYSDELRQYIVAVRGMIENREQLGQMVDFAKTNYEQLAVYVAYLNVSEIFE